MKFGPLWLMDLVALAYVAVVIVLAMMTYRWIEVPGRQYFNRIANRIGATSATRQAASRGV